MSSSNRHVKNSPPVTVASSKITPLPSIIESMAVISQRAPPVAHRWSNGGSRERKCLRWWATQRTPGRFWDHCKIAHNYFHMGVPKTGGHSNISLKHDHIIFVGFWWILWDITSKLKPFRDLPNISEPKSILYTFQLIAFLHRLAPLILTNLSLQVSLPPFRVDLHGMEFYIPKNPKKYPENGTEFQ